MNDDEIAGHIADPVVRALFLQQRTQAEQLADILETNKAIVERMAAMQTSIDENTAMTAGIKRVVEFSRTTRSIALWVGPLVLAVASGIAGFKLLMNGHSAPPPPGDGTP